MMTIYKVAALICDDCGFSHEGVEGTEQESSAAMTKRAEEAAQEDGFAKVGGMWFCHSCNPAAPILSYQERQE